MRIRRAVACAVVAVVVGLAGVSVLGQDVTLRYRWTKGESQRYRVTQETNAAMSGVPGMGEMTVRTTMVQVQQMTADDVAADGTATLRARFESMRMDMASPAGTFTYDSAAPPAQAAADPMMGQIAKIFGALVGESVVIVMSPTGAVQKVEGMTRIMQKVQAGAPGAGAMSGLGGLETMMNDDAMRGSFGQSFANLPTAPVKPGATWKTEITVPNPFGTMAISTVYTLKGAETVEGRELVRIGLTATIKAAPGGTPPAMPIPMTIQLSDGTGEGETVFDPKLGRVQRATFHTTLPMTMSMTAPDGTSMNMQALTKTTMTIELIEK